MEGKQKQLSELEERLYAKIGEESRKYEREIAVKEFEIAQYERMYDDMVMKRKLPDIFKIISVIMQSAILVLIFVLMN